jgi:hypothetical protein
MTLLEAVIAFVILSAVGIACLDQSRGAAQLQASSSEWTRAVELGEHAVAAEIGNLPSTAVSSGARARLPRVRVDRRRWSAGVDAVTASVSLSTGATYTITRLTPSGMR